MSTISRAVLTIGSAHEDVHALRRILAEHGHESSPTPSDAAFGIADETLLRAVADYRNANSVDAESIPGVVEHEAGRWIGPVLWDALLTPGGQPRKPAKPAKAAKS